MNRHKRNNKEQKAKLDEFPEDFDDVFFHNYTVEQDKNVSILRNIVYKKIKNSIIDRVSSYKDNEFLIDDKFIVEFETNEFNIFQWGVIREELIDRGFDASIELDENGKILSFQVPIERSLNLTETVKDRLESDDSDNE